MSIEITVRDPANTPRKELAIAIELLQRFYDAQNPIKADRTPPLPLAPADHPSAGVDIVTPEQAFASAVPNVPPSAPSIAAAEAFGTAHAAPAPTLTPAAPALVPPAPSAALSPESAVPAHSSRAGGVDLDAEGMPWDPRIHASGDKGPVKIANGTWRKKRGVDDALVAQVTAELHQAMSAPLAFGQDNVVANVPNVPPAPPTPPITAPTAAATIPTAPGGAPAPSANDFVGLATKVGAWATSGKLTQDEIAAACAMAGIPSLPALMSRPDLVPTVEASLLQFVAAKG